MNVNDYLIDELKRLNRMNDILEKKVNKNNYIENEPEQIVANALAMCEIASILKS